MVINVSAIKYKGDGDVKKWWIKAALLMGGLLAVSFSKEAMAADIFTQTFETGTGNWSQTVGTMGITKDANQVALSNTTQGTNIESVAILKDAPSRQDGEVEVSFLYEEQKNFSVVFRASETEAYNWQTVAYNGDGQWTIGQPGGKWISNITGPTLVAGTSYRLLVRYEKTSLTVYLNNQLFYENSDVRYPNGTSITSDWSGKVGLRLFGNRSTLKISQIKSGAVGSIKLSDEAQQQMSEMRKKWQTNSVGDFETNPSLLEDPEIRTYVENLSKEAEDVYAELDKRPDRVRLWPKVATQTTSADMTTQFKKLTILAKAYGTKGTTYYKDAAVLKEIISGLDFMTVPGRYSGQNYLGNWWDWQIGTPQELTTILMALGEDVAPQKVATYVQIMHCYLPDPYKQLQGQSQDKLVPLKFLANFKNSGANRTDQAISYLGMGLLIEDSDMVYTAVDSIQEIFQLVTEGDGFYQDGSFIQHYDIPYTGAYGNSLVKGVGDILSIVDQTNWQLEEANITQFVTNVQDAFLPIVVNGETMSFVNGRSITRSPSEKKQGMGSETMYNLLITAEFAKGEQKNRLQQAAKHWMSQNLPYYYQNTRNFKDLLLTKKVLADHSVDAKPTPFLGSHMYGAMDRYVYSGTNMQLGISMYSSRISAFEAGNKENKKGWHLSDGMVYIYNDDQQFGPAYWPTVDWYRFPGTTVDTTPLNDELTSFQSFKSPAAFVGGVSDTEHAVVAMQLDKTGWLNNGQDTKMNLQAKKSWVILDGKIISLGADINGNSASSIETVIDNRLLDPSSTYTFTNQSGKESNSQTKQNVATNDWFLLHSSKANQSLGYLMLEDQVVQTQQLERTGTYQEINNAYPSTEEYKGTYQQLILPHGQQASKGHYAYLTYPNATAEQLAALANEQPYTILENSAEIQAVKETKSQILAATIWNEAGGIIEGIQVSKPATLLYQQEANQQMTLSISNPKQTNETIEVVLPEEIAGVLAQDAGMTIKDSRTIVIDTTGGLGKTYQLKAMMKKGDSAESVQTNQQSLEIVKKGAQIPLQATVQPETAAATVQWTVAKEEIAEVKNNQLIAKKVGTTTVTVQTTNGKQASFTLRVTP